MNDKDTKKSKNSLGITVTQEDIVVAQNKNLELFVKNFSYQSENITAKHLGKIFGFFEIPETTDENAYIVNFLASVVKKEYFQNPRRSANESFEAALHKINLALTELVKQGNTEWLGKLEGAVAVIEGDTLHFSVTGDAAIFLYRNEESILISEGLADKASSIHPLKTFLEISSGKLMAGDTVLLSSPELFSLCSEEILQKNVSRMDFQGFARYIRAAMINELELGTSIVISVTKTTNNTPASKKASHLREESISRLQNVFSGNSFKNEPSASQSENLPVEDNPEPSEESSEYIDRKTGHIYIQGEAKEDEYQEPSWFKQAISEAAISLRETALKIVKRWSKKSKKIALIQGQKIKKTTSEMSQEVWKSTTNTATLLFQKSSDLVAAQKKSLSQKISEAKQHQLNNLPPIKIPKTEDRAVIETISAPSSKQKVFPKKIERENISFSLTTPEVKTVLTPREERLALFTKFTKTELRSQTTPHSMSFFSYLEKGIEAIENAVQTSFTILTWPTKTKKRLTLSVLLFCAGLVLIFIFTSSDSPKETSITTPPTPNMPTSTEEITEKSSLPLTDIDQYQGSETTLFTDSDNLYKIENNTLSINKETFTLPDNQTVNAVSYMRDLRLIFLWTNKNILLSFSTIDKKFNTNTLPLPADARVSSLGAYLTYLYVLDNNTGAIYRFPRTEGGFSEGATWLKNPLGKSENRTFVVADTIRISDSKTEQYSKGIAEKTLSDEALLLTNSNENNFTLGLNPNTGNIVVWNSDGVEMTQKTISDLQGVIALTYNEAQKKLFFAKNNTVYSLELTW